MKLRGEGNNDHKNICLPTEQVEYFNHLPNLDKKVFTIITMYILNPISYIRWIAHYLLENVTGAAGEE